MTRSRADGSAERFGLLSPLTAVAFSGLCWLVFGKLFDTREATALPELAQRFLLVQPWWLGAGLLGVMIAVLGQMRGRNPLWTRVTQVYSIALGVFSTVNIGWGIIAMYALILTPVEF